MQSPTHTITYRRVVDLSHDVHPGNPVWPGDPGIRFETVAAIAGGGYYLRRFSMGEHSGTHLSSPSAFYPDGDGPELLPAAALVTPGVVIDVSNQAAANPDYALSLDDLAAWERRNGTIPAGALALLYTGWQERWPHPERFINADANGIMHTPGFGPDAAAKLLHDRAAAGLGTDAPGIDPGTDQTLSISRLALAQPRLVLECVNNLNQLPPTGATIITGRLKLAGGSGSPAAVLALTP